MTYRVTLYGRLRDAGFGGAVILKTSKAMTAKELLHELSKQLGERAQLLDGCVLATDENILLPTERVPRSVGVLPPVCGG